MVFKFHSLTELREFIAFINADKDDVIQKESEKLKDSSKSLKLAVEKEKEK